MAQLYKMTLYVCDLQDQISLEEIKERISYIALDGVSVNCICHFSDEKIGANIDWDDDVDINMVDCGTAAWEKYFEVWNRRVNDENTKRKAD